MLSYTLFTIFLMATSSPVSLFLASTTQPKLPACRAAVYADERKS